MLKHELDEIEREISVQGCCEAAIQFLLSSSLIVTVTSHLLQGDMYTATADILVGTSLLPLLSISEHDRLKVLPISAIMVLVREIAQRAEVSDYFVDYNPYLLAGICILYALTLYAHTSHHPTKTDAN